MLSTKKITLLFMLLVVVGGTAAIAHAHGTMSYPPSRTWVCFGEGPQSPDSGGCQAAVAVGGTQQFYEWDMINQLPDGDHLSYVSDGQLCSGSKEKYYSLDQGLDSWAKFPLVPDENGMSSFVFDASVPHDTDYFDFYVTKDGWDPLEPLMWDTLEETPFCSSDIVPLVNGKYTMDCEIPADKEGYHIVYMIWQRTDSPEAFYGCSDVLMGEAALIPTPTPAPPPQPGECGSATWVDIVVYDNNDLVTWNGKEYKALWWTRGDIPDAPTDVFPWQEVGECSDLAGGGEPVVTEQPTTEPTEPTEVPIEPTDVPVDPIEPVDPTDVPPTDVPATAEPTPEPTQEPIPLNVGTRTIESGINLIWPLMAGMLFTLLIGGVIVRMNGKR